MSESWDIDPATGDYLQEKGNPIPTRSLRIPAYIRLKTHRTGWLYAPDQNYGSDFYALKKRQTTRDSINVETIAARALQPILDDGRASEIDVNTVVAVRNAIGMDVKIIDAQGEPEQLNIPSLGV